MDKPCPRLQFKWTSETDEQVSNKYCCQYSLILPLDKWDIRNDGSNELELKIGTTKCDFGSVKAPISNGKIDIPFRDYAHAIHDSESLDYMPIINCYGDRWEFVSH